MVQLGGKFLGIERFRLSDKVGLYPKTAVAVFLNEGPCLRICVVPSSFLIGTGAGKNLGSLLAAAYGDKHNTVRQSILNFSRKLRSSRIGKHLLLKKCRFSVEKLNVVSPFVLRRNVADRNDSNNQDYKDGGDYKGAFGP